MEVEKKTVTKEIQVCLSPSHYKWEDTGEVKTVERNGDSGTFLEALPIKKRVFVDAVYETKVIEQEVIYVKDGKDIHEFTDEVAANVFIYNKTKELK